MHISYKLVYTPKTRKNTLRIEAYLENVDISVSTFEETLLNGVTLKNIKGIEEAHFKSINIGTLDKPILLESEKAREWVLEKCEVSA